MVTRTVPLSEEDVAEIEKLGQDLLLAGDIRATKLLTLCLAWGFGAEWNPPEFVCDVDEGAGLADVLEFGGWSKRV